MTPAGFFLRWLAFTVGMGVLVLVVGFVMRLYDENETAATIINWLAIFLGLALAGLIATAFSLPSDPKNDD